MAMQVQWSGPGQGNDPYGGGWQGGQTPQLYYPPPQQPIKPDNTAAIIVVVFVAVAVVAIVFLASIGNLNWFDDGSSSGTINVYIHSSESTFNINYKVYFDGSYIGSGTVLPGATNAISSTVSFSGTSHTYTINAQGTVVGSGWSVSDSDAALLQNGGNIRVDLYL